MSGVALARAVDNGPRTIVLGVAACGVWAASAWFNGGFGTGAVAIEGIVLILVLALGLGVGRAGLVKPTGPRAVALAALAAFVAWTYASIAWAHVPGDAWVGAQKTLVYAVGFALFALFRYSPRSLERMLGVYVAALAVVAFAAIVQALHSPNSAFSEGRLQAPIGKPLLGKEAVPDDSSYTTGGVGLLGTRPSQEALESCDTLVIVGSSFPYIEFYPKPGQARIVQIDLDPKSQPRLP